VSGWLGKLFGIKTAVQMGRKNPAMLATIEKSSLIYNQIPLREFVDEASRQKLSRQLYLDINEICNSTNSVTACREKLSLTMLDFALYQVLVIPPVTEDDASGLRGQPGISGELQEHVFSLASKNDDLCTELRDLEVPMTPDAVWNFVQESYWTKYWILETINAARIELGDWDEEEDWYKPFMHAACANREHIYRRDLALSSCFEQGVADVAPTAYSIFTDIVLSGAANPAREWREYYKDSDIPYPRFDT